MGEAMKKVDHLVARAFKSAMAFVLAVGLCPVAPAMAQEGATANEEEGTAAAAVDGADVSTDGAVAGAAGGVAGSEADGVQPGGVSGDADAAADGAGVGAPAQDAVENDDAGSGVSVDAAEAADATDEEADESNDAVAQTDGWQACGGCEWMIDAEGCLTIRPKDGAEVGQLPDAGGYAPWCASEYKRNIKAVRVENGVKASEYAGDLFRGLSCAEAMELSGLDTSSVTDMGGMFYGCSSLASLDVSGWDTSRVANMSWMFYGCPNMVSLDASNWDTSCVTDMQSMFYGCSKLASLDVSGWDTSRVADMSMMFFNCSELASLDVSGWDASRVTEMSMMFFRCFSLASLDVSGWDTSSATDMSSMFSDCSSLAALDVSGWDTSSVTDMGGMFYGCSSLASLDVSGWDTSCVTDMGHTFSGCSSLAALDASAWDTSSATDMDSMFYGCSKLASIDVSAWDVSSATGMIGMFYGCSKLASLDVSGWDTSRVTDMSFMFYGCSKLASLDVSGWDTSRVARMPRMFSGCSSLTSLDASNWDTSCVTDMASMFSGCSSLASLDLSSWDASNVGGMEGMFYACLRLEQIAVGDGFDLCRVTVDPSLVEGWTGKWVNQAGDAFPMAAIPSGTKDVYRAQIALRDDMFEVDCSDSPYTGSEITKEIRSSKLQEGVDYEVSYSDNVSAGTASISICGIGRAVGLLHYEFNITKKPPTFDAPAPLDATYGQKLADLMLPEGFSWQDAGDADVGDPGEHEYLAMYTPSDETEYETVRDVPVKVRVTRDIDASMFSVDAAGLVYDGSAHEPAVSSGVVPEGSYSVGYRDNVSAGEAAAVVSGEGFYRGSCELKFVIAKATPDYEAPAPVEAAYGQTLSDAALPEGFSWQDGDIVVDWYGKKTLFVRFTPNDQANYNSIDGIPVDVVVRHKDLKTAEIKFEGSQFEYTGHLVKPSPSIAMDGESLVEGVDYSVEYRNNVLPGKAEALVCGMGRFAGSSVGVSFDIVRSAGNYIALPGHWATGSGGWWYPYDNGGYPANEWCIIDGSYYHFDGSGYMQTGWLNLGGTWYYLSGSGIMQTGWQKIGGSWYWFDDSGAMVTGWKQIGGTYYYFDGSGAMQTGWLSTGGAWYYLSGSGAMATGWLSLGGTWYWFDDSGAMASGWKRIDGSYYYFSGSGAMQTGWLSYGGAWYWLGDSGAMATGWKWIGGSCYYFDGSGAMQANKWIDGSYVDSDGRWAQNA